MTKQEFFERTGVEVSDNEFWALHETYCFSELDKDEFCKMWCKMNARRVKNAKAERMIQQREQSYRLLVRCSLPAERMYIDDIGFETVDAIPLHPTLNKTNEMTQLHK